jgi:hypothetical protein
VTAAPASLDAWKALHCFGGSSPETLLELEYVNQGDLALGRRLHMTNCNGGVFAFVENFGVGGDAVIDGVHALASGKSNGAAVAMEWQPGNPKGYEVQFVAYAKNPVTGESERTTQIDFDQEGPKFSPFACTVCHGGHYEPSTRQVKDAFFVPLLIESLTFRNFKVSDQEALRKMNAIIYDVKGTDQAPGIAQVLDAAYPGAFPGAGVKTTGATYQSNQVPPVWQSQKDLYLGLLRPHCVPCHDAQLSPPVSHGFVTPQELPAAADIKAFACGLKLMPQSLEGRKHFQADPDAGKLAGCE